MNQKRYHILGHKVLNITEYFVKRYYLYMSREIEKKILKIIEYHHSSNELTLLHKSHHDHGKFMQNYIFQFSFRNKNHIKQWQ